MKGGEDMRRITCVFKQKQKRSKAVRLIQFQDSKFAVEYLSKFAGELRPNGGSYNIPSYYAALVMFNSAKI